jgi:hypothetical protein
MPWATIILLCLFALALQLGIGGVHWVYLPEILNDAQFGWVSTVHYSGGIFVAVSTEYLIKLL